jgi:hypothetical protein
MTILLAYASRSRPDLFRRRIQDWLGKAANRFQVIVSCAFDQDDATMDNDAMRAFCSQWGVLYEYGNASNKIEAINRAPNAAKDQPWDIIVCLSDDMACQLEGWDDRMRADMARHFPNFDGGLWYPDGRQLRLNTFSVIGREAYNALGHIYDPRFKSVFCDDWYQNVMIRRNALRFVDVDLVRHEWGQDNRDALMRRNEAKPVHEADRRTWVGLTDIR